MSRSTPAYQPQSSILPAMAPTKVIIAGCGIAGPVLALLLKQKGYSPVIYERGKRSPDAGLSLMCVCLKLTQRTLPQALLLRLQLNGFRVLSLIPGLLELLPKRTLDEAAVYSVVPSDERVLGQSDFPAELRREYGHGMVGIRRPELIALLADTAIAHGIEVHFERQVVGIEQTDGYASVRLENGDTDSGSFVVGCDGLHSNVRVALFGKEDATFTGLTQVGACVLFPFSAVRVLKISRLAGSRPWRLQTASRRCSIFTAKTCTLLRIPSQKLATLGRSYHNFHE
jgi:salicylate hydroxylase